MKKAIYTSRQNSERTSTSHLQKWFRTWAICIPTLHIRCLDRVFSPTVKNSHTWWHPETLPSTGWGYWVVLLGHVASDPFRKWAQFTLVSHVDISSDSSDDFSTLENSVLCQVNAMNQQSSKLNGASEASFWNWVDEPQHLFASKVDSALMEREAPNRSCRAVEGTELRGRFIHSKNVRNVIPKDENWKYEME